MNFSYHLYVTNICDVLCSGGHGAAGGGGHEQV